jgi:hypothetical protein
MMLEKNSDEAIPCIRELDSKIRAEDLIMKAKVALTSIVAAGFASASRTWMAFCVPSGTGAVPAGSTRSPISDRMWRATPHRAM